MASSRNAPVSKRIAFALRCYYVTATSSPSVKDVEEVMKKKDKDFDLLEPRPFGVLARVAFTEICESDKEEE